jgi:hypothetical protein
MRRRVYDLRGARSTAARFARVLRFRTICALLAAACIATAVAACGSSSSSGQANSLLRQTFSGKHTVNSGNLNVSVSVNPSGSSTLRGPITLSFGGPFASLGTGKLPKSDFTVSISALGRTGSLGILSTGTAGYVTLSGKSYRLPPATFQQLESSFSSLTSSSGGSSGSGALSKLGIDPLHWLVKPTIVGNESVSGSSTTHIRARIDVAKLLDDLNTFLGKAPSVGVSGLGKVPSSISPASRERIAREIRQPRFDVWTGSADKTLRKMAISLVLPVTGQLSSLLGGLSSAQVSLTMQYADLNQPQTITAPSSVAPYSQFQAKLRTLLSALQSSVGGSLGSSGTGSAGSSSTGSSSSAVSSYAQCLQKAGSNLAQAQKCASLLNGK